MARRGGGWGYAGDAGVFAVNLNNHRGNVNVNIGFRPASPRLARRRALTGARPAPGGNGALPPRWAAPTGAAGETHELPGRRLVGQGRTAPRPAPSQGGDIRLKRFGSLYPQVYDFENLYAAYRKARLGHRFEPEVLSFTRNLEENLIVLQNELIWRTYRVGPYREFFIHDPKKRLVAALPFRDRVVQWAVVRVIEPLFDRAFIHDSYACRVGKGTHAAADRLQYWLRYLARRHSKVYALHIDISKYFYRIDHAVLRAILGRRIKDRDLLWLLDVIIDSGEFGLPVDATGFDGPRVPGVGLPIGNLTSQLFANIYLDQADQFAKHRLRLRWYMRYMDDIIVLHPDKRVLRWAKDELQAFLEDRLHLTVSPKTSIRPISQGIDWVGYRVWPTHSLIRRRTKIRIRRRLAQCRRLYAAGLMPWEEVRSVVMSYLGHLRHCNSYNLRRRIISTVAFCRSPTAAHC